MVKSGNTESDKDAQPAIWAEGKQHVPLEADVLARVAVIMARRAAASAWNEGSILVANAAIAVEDGFGKGFVGRLGRLSLVLPPREGVCLALAHFSHLESKASAVINHVGEAVAPLEGGDLTKFMEAKRQEARLAAAERARKEQIARMAHERAKRIGSKVAPPSAPLPSAKQGAASEQVSSKAESEDLSAIRAALAAYSGPEPAPAQVEPEAPQKRPAPSRSLFDHAHTGNTDTANLPPDHVVMSAARPVSLFSPLKKLAVLPALTWRGLVWATARFWTLAGPAITGASAWALGWAMFVVVLPLGLYRAVRAHLNGQDLRYFD